MIVSFILPIYNTPVDLLRHGLDIILKNRNDDIEVILIDDGSEKIVADIIDEYGQKDDMFRVFHQNNKGVSVARNVGIQMAQSKYIVFVDPDDYVLPSIFDINFFKNNNSEVILFDFIRKNFDGTESFVTIKNKNDIVSRTELIKNVLFCKNKYGDYYAGAIWAKAFDKNFLINNEIYFDENLRKAQDRMFMLEIYYKAENILLSDKCTYVYFENLQSICNKYKSGSSIRSEKFAYSVEKRVNEIEDFNEQQLAISKTFFEMYFEMLYLDIFNIKSKQKYLKKRKTALEKYSSLDLKRRLKNLKLSDCLNMNEKIKLFLIKYKIIDILHLIIIFRQRKRM